MIRMIASTTFFAALDCRLMMMILLMTSGLLRYGSRSDVNFRSVSDAGMSRVSVEEFEGISLQGLSTRRKAGICSPRCAHFALIASTFAACAIPSWPNNFLRLLDGNLAYSCCL